MPTRVIDIHPHIIATDTRRYPLAPLGGHQSEWSRTRPVTTEQMLEAMDEAGVGQVRHGAGLDLLWPRQFLCRRRCRGASGPLHGGVLGGRAGARRERAHPLLGRPEAHGAAAVHHRQHHAGPGLLARRSEVLSGLADRRRSRHPDLSANVAEGISGDDPDDRALPEGEDHPRPLRPAGAQRRPALCAGAEPVRPRQISEHPPEAHPAQFHRNRRTGRRRPRPFSRKLVGAFGAQRLAWGSNYPASEGSLADLLALAKRTLACLPQSDQDWIFAKTAQTLYPALAD